MRCLAVSVDKVHRLGKQTIVPEVDRTGVGWQRSSVEERREHATILCVPPAGRLVRLLHRRIRLSGRQIELIVHENFQPEYTLSSHSAKGVVDRSRAQIRRQQFE